MATIIICTTISFALVVIAVFGYQREIDNADSYTTPIVISFLLYIIGTIIVGGLWVKQLPSEITHRIEICIDDNSPLEVEEYYIDTITCDTIKYITK